MNGVLNAHEAIYDRFHSSAAMQAHFFAQGQKDAYAAYYTSMYLIQDTAEAVWTHMQSGFSREPMQAYIEFWGVMQAIAIQQDAICELHQAVVGAQCKTKQLPAWNDLRDKRNLCAGHPANRAHGRPAPQRAFMGRGFGNYHSICYEMWDAHTRTMTHPTFDMSKLIGQYDAEAEVILLGILASMQTRWP